jgi:ribonuclease BN (tRNA processing enzyme)
MPSSSTPEMAFTGRTATPGRAPFPLLSLPPGPHRGLHVLSKFRFKSLTIFGQKGTRAALNTIINEPFTVPLDKLPYPAEVRELTPGPYKLPFALDCSFLVHASPCLGYRFDLDGRIIAYCPDTGVCENAVLLAGDADLLIAECAHLPGEQNPMAHLNPEDAAAILTAKANGSLTHFDAGFTPACK